MEAPIQQVQIDPSWIAGYSKDKAQIDLSFCSCMVCHGIVMSQPAECNKCKKILCQEDFNQVKSTKDKCPNCTVSPFIKSDVAHPLIVDRLDKLRFKCKMCPKPAPVITPQY